MSDALRIDAETRQRIEWALEEWTKAIGADSASAMIGFKRRDGQGVNIHVSQPAEGNMEEVK